MHAFKFTLREEHGINSYATTYVLAILARLPIILPIQLLNYHTKTGRLSSTYSFFRSLDLLSIRAHGFHVDRETDMC